MLPRGPQDGNSDGTICVASHPGHHHPSGMGRREGIHGASSSGRKTVILREILEAAEGRGASWRSVNVAGVRVGYVSLLV